MKTLRYTIHLFFSFVLAISLFQPSILFSALAESSGSFIYELSDNNAIITGYTGNESTVVIPDEVDSHTVIKIGDHAFDNNITATSVSIPDTVTSIGNSAFNECIRLSNITLSNSLTEIGDYAFFSCTNLKSIKFPSTLTTIGKGAFFLCSSVTEYFIPKSVSSIGDYAFASTLIQNEEFIHVHGSALTKVTFEEGSALTKIPNQCFQYDQYLETVTIPEGVIEIGDRAFEGCKPLTGIILPDSLKKIGVQAFRDCSSIKKLNIPAEIIGDRAFMDCYGVTELSFPNVKTIGHHAFFNAGSPMNEAFPSITLPATLTDVQEDSFSQFRYGSVQVAEGNPVLTVTGPVIYRKNSDNGKTLLQYSSYSGVSEITIDSDTTRISDEAFMTDNTELKLFTIPDTVTEIGDKAFCQAFSSEVTSFVIPDSVTTLGKEAFAKNGNLESITVGSGITTLPEGTFMQDYELKTIELNGLITSIGEQCFSQIGEAQIKLPDTVKDIHAGACSDWSVIQNYGANFKVDEANHLLLSADGTTVYAYMPYPDDDGNHAITVPDGVTTIKDYALTYAYARLSNPMFKYYLPESITTIGTNAIGCKLIPDVAYPPGVLLISDSDKVKEYAQEHDIACFSDEPVLNLTEASIAKDETVTLSLSNARTDVLYFTSDRTIATVSDEGVITGISKGNCQVYAATGGYFCKADITVTSGEYPWDTSETNTYLDQGDSMSTEWAETYKRLNPIVNEYYSNIATVIYTGQAFMPMMGLHYQKNYDNTSMLENSVYPNMDYGRLIDQFNKLNDNLDTEVTRTENGSDNLVLYSGTPDIWEYTGSDNSLKAMKESIGKTVTFKSMISTSLTHSVASTFAGDSGDGTVLEIYLPKDAKVGSYIKGVSVNLQEDEFLLRSMTKFKIFDAGIREVQFKKEYTEEIETKTERYMKLLLLTGDAPMDSFEPYIVTPEPPAPTPSATPTVAPTVAPTAKPSQSPTQKPSAVVTCQDAGYPANYYWDESKKACVAPATAAPTPNNAITSANKTPSPIPTATAYASPENKEVTESPKTEESSTPSAEASYTPTINSQEESDFHIDIVNTNGPMWFLGIPIAMILAGLGVYLLGNPSLIPWIIGANVIVSMILAILDHSLVGWILLLLNFAAVGLLALYRHGKPETIDNPDEEV